MIAKKEQQQGPGRWSRLLFSSLPLDGMHLISDMGGRVLPTI